MMTNMEENNISKYSDEVFDRDRHVVMTSMDSTRPFAAVAANGELEKISNSCRASYGHFRRR
jgi:hypothetical protein